MALRSLAFMTVVTCILTFVLAHPVYDDDSKLNVLTTLAHAPILLPLDSAALFGNLLDNHRPARRDNGVIATPSEDNKVEARQTCSCASNTDCSCDTTVVTLFQGSNAIVQLVSTMNGEFGDLLAPYNSEPIDSASLSAGACAFCGNGPPGEAICLPSCGGVDGCSISFPAGTTVLGWVCWPTFPVGVSLCQTNCDTLKRHTTLETRDEGSTTARPIDRKNTGMEKLQETHVCACLPDTDCSCEPTYVWLWSKGDGDLFAVPMDGTVGTIPASVFNNQPDSPVDKVMISVGVCSFYGINGACLPVWNAGEQEMTGVVITAIQCWPALQSGIDTCYGVIPPP